MKLHYKDYELEPVPEKQLTTGKWTTHIRIIKHIVNGQVTKNFSSTDIHDTEEAAEKASIIFGQQIIDGIYKEFSVSGI